MGHVPNEEDKVKLIYSAIVIITLLPLIGSAVRLESGLRKCKICDAELMIRGIWNSLNIEDSSYCCYWKLMTQN